MLEMVQEPTEWSDLQAGVEKGMGCKHIQVLANLVQNLWERQADREGKPKKWSAQVQHAVHGHPGHEDGVPFGKAQGDRQGVA